MSQVAFNNVSKIFPGEKGGEFAAVRDFTLEISPREFVVLVGPSGCGKSTVLRMLAGLEEATRGDILMGGRRVNDVAPKDRDIAMVFQNYALYPHMSVYDNLAFGLKLRKLPKAEIKKRVNDTAETLGLQQLLDRKPKALSGGQCQRVAVGRAIVRQPKVFLFDEPLSNLDARLRTQMRAEITKLHQRLQATILYVTHDQVEAMTMGTRIVVMDATLNPETGQKEGAIQQIDTPMNLYRKPVNMFVSGFLGSPPMNFIKGTLRKDGEQLCFKEVQGGVIEARLDRRPAAEAYLGREVVMGVRPEHCRLVPPETPGSFQALADLVEPMGAETYFHLQTGAHTIIARTQGSHDREEAGHRQRFEIATGEAHLFDPATTRRIE